jgi:hypothetical protein
MWMLVEHWSVERYGCPPTLTCAEHSLEGVALMCVGHCCPPAIGMGMLHEPLWAVLLPLGRASREPMGPS